MAHIPMGILGKRRRTTQVLYKSRSLLFTLRALVTCDLTRNQFCKEKYLRVKIAYRTAERVISGRKFSVFFLHRVEKSLLLRPIKFLLAKDSKMEKEKVCKELMTVSRIKALKAIPRFMKIK